MPATKKLTMPATVKNVEENTLSLPSEPTGIKSHTNTHTHKCACAHFLLCPHPIIPLLSVV